VIHAKDITTKGFEIDRPGSWCLDGDIEFNPPPSQFAPPDPRAVQAAITIKAGVSNVILNLGNHRITQAGAGTSSQTPYCIGILVPDPAPSNTDPNFVGAQSIYIQGDQGIIDGFSMYGVKIFAHTQDIQLSDLTIKNCGLLASKALRPTGYIPHGNNQPLLGPPFSVAGLSIGESDSVGRGPVFFTQTPGIQNKVSSVIIENVSCLNNFYRGIEGVNLIDVAIKNSHFDKTFSDDPGSSVAPAYGDLSPWGADFVGDNSSQEDPCIKNMMVSNSTFNETTFRGNFTTSIFNNGIGAGLIITGVFAGKNNNVMWENCQFNGTFNTFFGGFSSGQISTGSEGNTFLNCSFDNTRALSSANGFSLLENSVNTPFKSVKDTYLINCTARNIQQIGDQQLPTPVLQGGSTQAVGFRTRNTKNLVMINCLAQDVSASGPMDGTGQVIGFQIEDSLVAPNDTTTANIILEGCIAQQCKAFNGGRALGFVCFAINPTSELDGYVLKDCISEGHETLVPTLVTPGIVRSIACGYYVQQNPTLTSIPMSFTNCKALHNKGPVSAADTVPANGTIYSAGFYVLKTLRANFTECESIDCNNGFFLQQCDRCTVRDCRADNNLDIASGTGAGFIDIGTPGTPLGTLGTPASPGLSTSVFESNRAFANGANVDTGANGNYNVLYGAGLVPLPILTGNLTVPTFPSSALFQPTINVSMTK